MNMVDHMQAVLEGQASQNITAFSLEVANNLRQRLIAGSLGPDSIGSGKIAITGTLQMYFETATIMDKYLNQTVSSLAFIIEDSSGNAYIIDLPEIKYTDGARVAGGENTDILADMTFGVRRDAAEDTMIRVVRFAA